MSKRRILILTGHLVFLLTNVGLGQRNYVYELHVGKKPGYDSATINGAIALLMELDPAQEVLKCIYVHPGEYWEQLNDSYRGCADFHHETNGHNLPRHCDLIGVGAAREQIVIKHYSGYYGADEKLKNRITQAGIACNGDNILANLSIVNPNLATDKSEPETLSPSWGWVQDGVVFLGHGELRNCVVASHHQAVTGRASLVVRDSDITAWFLACIEAQGAFTISNCHLHLTSASSNMEWPVGVSACASGVIDKVVINGSATYRNSIFGSASLTGVCLCGLDQSDIVRISDTDISVELTSRGDDVDELTVCGIGSYANCEGRAVVRDCTVNVRGKEDGGGGIGVYGICVAGGTIEVWGHTSVSVAEEGNAPRGYEYSLHNDGGRLIRDPDPEQVVYDRSKESGEISDLFRVMNLSQGRRYVSIKEAIDKADPNDTVEIVPGVHHEAVSVVGKAIRLIGAVNPATCWILGHAVINADGADAAVVFRAGSTGSFLSGVIVRNAINGVACEDSSCVIENNWIHDNLCGLRFSGASCICDVRNNTVVENSDYGIYAISGSAPDIRNCILWNNGDDLHDSGAIYSCIEDGDTGIGNISSDPKFVDPAHRDYHLQVDSPCVGKGDANGLSPTTDIEGDERIVGDGIDMGADEVVARARNVNLGVSYLSIQDAIDQALAGQTIEVVEGEHYEAIDFKGKPIVVRGADPNDWGVISSTILMPTTGADSTVAFVSGEGRGSTVCGITISGARYGVVCRANSSPTIHRCIVERANQCGIYSDIASPLVSHCRITNNTSSGLLSGRSQLTVRDSWIYGNGVGILCGLGSISSLAVHNSTIAYNDTGIRLTYGSANVANSILWNTVDDLSGCHAVYSCIGNADDGNGEGNIIDNPCFENPSLGDFHLRTDSPCINAGDPQYLPEPGEVDLDGDPRIMDGIVDMGADEAQAKPNVVPSLSDALDTTLSFTTSWGDAGWFAQAATYYYGSRAAQSGDISDNKESWMQTTVTVPADWPDADLSFYWKVSSEEGFGWLEFYIDSSLQHRISGLLDWQKKSYSLSAGSHTLKWRYIKDGGGDGGCGWVDKLECVPPPPPPTNVQASDGAYGDKVQVTWTASSGATGYKVFRNTSNSAAGAVQIADVSSLFYDDTAADPMTTYWYWVGAYNNARDSALSDADTGYRRSISLSEAVDEPSLRIRTGGGANWAVDTNEFYYDAGAAQSGDISDNQESWMQTTVTVPDDWPLADLSFYWKVSSEKGCDWLEFYIDSGLQHRISGLVDWQKKSYTLSAGSHTLKWRYIKDDGDDGGSDCCWVDKLECVPPPSPPTDVQASDGAYGDKVQVTWTASSGATGYRVFRNTSNSAAGAVQIADVSYLFYDDTAADPMTTYWYWVGAYNNAGDSALSDADSGYRRGISLSEAVDEPSLSFAVGGNAKWFGQSVTSCYGGDAAQSGDISNNQESWMQTTVTVPEDWPLADLSFYWKVSSEKGCDWLEFYIDGGLQNRISGSVDWQKKSYPLSAGSHTLKWRYIKDGGADGGSDCCWVDKLECVGPPPPDPPNQDGSLTDLRQSGRR